MDLKESTDKDLRKLNKLNRIESINENIKKTSKIMEDLEKDEYKKQLNHNFKKIYNIFLKKHIFEKFKNTLILRVQKRYSKYLEPLNNEENYRKLKYNNLNKSIDELDKYIKKFKCKITKRNHNLFEKVAQLTHTLESLISVFNNELIAIDLPKNMYTDLPKNMYNNSRYFPYESSHFTLTIKTEESYPRFTDYREISKFRSTLSGESVKYLLICYVYDRGSSYYEITPPENTQIVTVKRDNKRKTKCNFMMETEESKKNNKEIVVFEKGFNERLVIHIPRHREYPNFGYRFSIRFRPFTVLQWWIFISFVLCIFYIGFLLYLFAIIDPNSKYFLIYRDLIDLAKFQAPWIYGLLIGNQLWLQRPKFLWNKSTILSIIILLSGIICLILCVCRSSLLFNIIN
ncbi:MAG: hypothetical protein ACFE9R_18240 [Candidatus Hermodarchaeota archaeon]